MWPPQSLHLLRSRPCSHLFFPMPTFVHEVRRRDALIEITTRALADLQPTQARCSKRALLAEKFWHALAAKETALLLRVNGLTAKLDVTYVA